MDENKIQKYMKLLHIDREEAIQVIKDDEAVDKMTSIKEINSDLTEEQKKAVKKARQSSRKPTVYNFDKPKRKKPENLDKKALIETIKSALAESGCTDFEITSAEREFLFFSNGVKYKITMACPRK